MNHLTERFYQDRLDAYLDTLSDSNPRSRRHRRLPKPDHTAALSSSPSGVVSMHASVRVRQRGIRWELVQLALTYGRRYFRRGAEVYALGERQRAIVLEAGYDPRKALGVSVVCDPYTWAVITVYRITNFRRLRNSHRSSARGLARC